MIFSIFMVIIVWREPESRILVHVARGGCVFDRQGSRKYLNASERRAYLHAVRSEPDIARKAFCLTLFYTGCRISEALNLKTERIDLAGKAIVFETLKRRRCGCFRAVPIPGSLVELLDRLLKTMDPLARVWNFSRATGYRLVKEHMAHASVAGGMASPKGLRHGVAVACVAQKIPLPTVQKWLGHARLETTAIYLDVSGEEERDLAKRFWQA
jgi:integrase/recombinase XerD